MNLDAQPTSPQLVRHVAGHVAAGEGVEHELSRLGQEANKKLRHLSGKACGVDGQAGDAAAAKILITGTGVGHLQQIRGNGAAVVTTEVGTNLVLRRTLGCLVTVPQKAAHRSTVGTEHT